LREAPFFSGRQGLQNFNQALSRCKQSGLSVQRNARKRTQRTQENT